MSPASAVHLEFSAQYADIDQGKELKDGLFVALQIGDTLWFISCPYA
jgi:hypothetical protein